MAGKRFTMDEAGLYTVKDGKIVHEEFFYHMASDCPFTPGRPRVTTHQEIVPSTSWRYLMPRFHLTPKALLLVALCSLMGIGTTVRADDAPSGKLVVTKATYGDLPTAPRATSPRKWWRWSRKTS